MKHFTLFLLVFTLGIFNQNAIAQNTSSIRGTVIDSQSEMPLIGVTVVLDNDLEKATVTDLDGNFRLENVVVGRHSLQATYVGYNAANLNNLLVRSGKDLAIDVLLEEKIEDLNEVVVTADKEKYKPINQLATVSARALTVEEANRYAGSLGDVARMAQNFAGVSGASDDRNDIIIRGNSPTGVLWRLEGIDIPSPNHFSALGTTGGPVSIVNNNNLKNSDFFTGAFPAEYGNAMSGVFDLQLRNGNTDKFEFLGQSGFNGVEFGAEGPLSKKSNASFVVNYRYSFLGLVNALGLEIGTGGSTPEYQDLTFKLNFPTKKAGRFSIFGIGGVSDIAFLADSDTTELDFYGDDNTDLYFGSKTGVIGASHLFFLSPNTTSKLVVAASGTQTNGELDEVFVEDEQVKRRPETAFQYQQTKYSLNYRLNHKLNAKNTTTFGVIGDVYGMDLRDSSRVGDTEEFGKDFDLNENTSLVQAYTNWQHRFNEKLTLNTGLHYQYFMFNGSQSLEPRMGLKYKAGQNIFSAGTGLHSQLQPIMVYFLENREAETPKLPNEDLVMSKAIHFVGGYERLLGESVRLKTEAYYQYVYDVAVDDEPSAFSMLNAGSDFGLPNRRGLVNDGTGANYGLEITLEKFFTKGFYFLTTASLFDSKYTASDNIKRNTIFNSRYAFNLLGGKEFKIGENATFGIDVKFAYAGGVRYTPIDIEASKLAGEAVYFADQVFEEQEAAYIRPDFKVTFRTNGKHLSQQWSVDFQNFINRQNVFDQAFNPNTGELETTYQRGFFPDVNYRIYF